MPSESHQVMVEEIVVADPIPDAEFTTKETLKKREEKQK